MRMRRGSLFIPALFGLVAAAAPHARAATGRFDTVREQIGHMIRLVEADGRLQLDREHWAELVGGENRQAILDREMAGYPGENRAERQADLMESMDQYAPGVSALRYIVQPKAGFRSGTTSHRNGRGSGHEFRGEGLTASVEQTGEDVEIFFEEESSPGRRIEVAEKTTGAQRLMLI